MAADSGIKSGEVVPRRSEAEWADVIRADLAASAQGIIDAGWHLAQAKEQVRRGHWQAWLCRLGLSDRTAQRFMAIGRNPVLSNTTHVSHLPASWGTLYELSRVPDGQLRKAIERGVVTPEMERSAASGLVPPKPRDPHADLKDELGAGAASLAAANRATERQIEAAARLHGREPVPDSMTTATVAAETVTVTEKPPHVCVYKMRCECGQEDKAFSADFDALDALAEGKYRQQVAGLQAEVARLEDENAELRRSAPLDGAGGTGHGNGTKAPQYDVSGDQVPDCEQPDPVPDDEFDELFR